MKPTVIVLLALIASCHYKVNPRYSVLVNYEYNYRTKEGKQTDFPIDFRRNYVLIDGIRHDLKLKGCNSHVCVWQNHLFILKHHYQRHAIKVELMYEKEHVSWDTKFAFFNVQTLEGRPITH